MDKNIDIENIFADLAECTEYYYDELGKLGSVRNESNQLTKREAKTLHKFIMFFFYSSLNTLKSKMKATNTVDKTEIKEFNKDYKKEHQIGFLNGISKLSHKLKPTKLIGFIKSRKINDTRIELISPDEVKALEDSSSLEEEQQNLLEF